MFNLIKKDIFVSCDKRFLIQSLIYIVFMAFMLKLNNMPFNENYLINTITASFFISLTSFVYDDKNNSNCIICSLPVTKKEIVFSKYVSIIIYSITFPVLILLIYKLLGYIGLGTLLGITNFDLFNNSVYYLKSILITCILASFIFPAYFKYGYKKAKLFFVAFYMIFFFTMTAVIADGNNIYLNFLREAFNFSNKSGVFTLLITLLIFILSIVISSILYENKEM